MRGMTTEVAKDDSTSCRAPSAGNRTPAALRCIPSSFPSTEETMRKSVSLMMLSVIATAVACVQPVNTVPPVVAPTDAVQRYDLQVPSDLDIRSIDFSATTFSDVSGQPHGVTSS